MLANQELKEQTTKIYSMEQEVEDLNGVNENVRSEKETLKCQVDKLQEDVQQLRQGYGIGYSPFSCF